MVAVLDRVTVFEAPVAHQKASPGGTINHSHGGGYLNFKS